MEPIVVWNRASRLFLTDRRTNIIDKDNFSVSVPLSNKCVLWNANKLLVFLWNFSFPLMSPNYYPYHFPSVFPRRSNPDIAWRLGGFYLQFSDTRQRQQGTIKTHVSTRNRQRTQNKQSQKRQHSMIISLNCYRLLLLKLIVVSACKKLKSTIF